MSVAARPRKIAPLLSDARPDLAAQWHPDNSTTPNRVTVGSHYRATWVCDKDSRHVWEARVAHRAHGRGCPVCRGRKIVAGLNDLGSTHPDLAREWAPRNKVPLSEISFGSNKRVWWCCEHGHEWDATPNRRTALGHGCPVCSGKRVARGINDMATTHPDLAARVHPDSPVKPTEVSHGSSRTLLWQCGGDPSHVWEAKAQELSRGYGCPLCAGTRVVQGVNDLATTNPDLAAQWHPDNCAITAFHAGSHSRVQWVCDKDSRHVWSSEIRARAERGQGCPVCGGGKIITGVNDLATRDSSLAAQWSPRNSVSPTQVALNSNTSVWWKCRKGHEWFVSPNQRVSLGTGCPVCASNTFTSKGEDCLAAWVASVVDGDVLRNFRNVLRGNELDVYIPSKKIAIEYNGLYYHSSRFRATGYHADKVSACSAAGVRLIQVWEHDWRDRRDIVQRMLRSALGASTDAKVGARRTSFVEVSPSDARAFFNKNHIQGELFASKTFGLEHDGELVAAMAVKRRGGIAHIARYATSCTVQGGFTKLMAAAEPWAVSQGATIWETFADLSWSNGDMYRTAGFVEDGMLPPDYKYLYRDVLRHKFLFRKKRFRDDPLLTFEEGLTEAKLAELNNISRVYDSGKIRFRKAISSVNVGSVLVVLLP